MKRNMKKSFGMLLACCLLVLTFLAFPLASNAADAETMTSVTYEKYTDISPYRVDGDYTAPEKDGYIFGGWFTSASDAQAVGQDVKSGSAYAKFVPEDVLTVKVQVTKKMLDNPESVKFRLVTSVDSLKYQKVGFDVTINNVTRPIETTEVFESIVVTDSKNGQSMHDPDLVFCGASSHFATARIKGFTRNLFETLEISATPWWLTKDGTYVKGESRNRMLISDERTNDSDGSATGETADFTVSDKTSYTYKIEESGETASYQYFKGGSDTVYLAGKYTTTGSTNNVFGITIRNGGQTRQVYFNEMGVKILANTSKTNSGIVDQVADVYNTITNTQEVFVWGQTGNGNDERHFRANQSTIKNMVTERIAGTHDVIWAIWENVLYCSVDGSVVLRLPMKQLCNEWEQGRSYQLGIAAYNNTSTTGALKFVVETLKFDKEAKSLLKLESEKMSLTNVAYEPITGSYMASTQTGAAYAYGTAVDINTPIAVETNLEWQNVNISDGRAGITVKFDDNNQATAQIYFLYAGSTYGFGTRLQTGHSWNDPEIYRTSSFTALPVNGENSCNIKAAVYDGKLSILVNDVTAYECTLSSLYSNYSSAKTLSLGIATWDNNRGQTQFKDVLFHKGSEAVALKTENWTFHPQSSEKIASIDTKAGTVTTSGTQTGWKKLEFTGASKVWEFSGTMTHEAAAIANMQGFYIWNTSKKVMLVGNNVAFATIDNDDWETASVYKYNSAGNKYAFQEEDYFKTITADSVSFKAMIVDDVFFVWLNEKLSWMIPLEETEFGGFAADSEYSVGLRFGDQAMAQEFKIDSVKTGSEVDATLVKTLKSCQHFNWLSAKAMKTLSTDGKVVTIDNTTKGNRHVLSNTADETVWLSGTWKDVTKQANGFTYMYGITIQDEIGTNRQVRFEYEGINVMYGNDYWKPDEVTSMDVYKTIDLSSDGYVWAQRKSTNGTLNSSLRKMITNTSGETDEIIWAIKDNTLYCSINGFTSVVLPLEKICSTWTAESTHRYQIGFSQRDTQANGDVEVSNVELLYGTDAENKLSENTIASDISENTRMVYDAIEGSYMPRLRTGFAGMYGPAAKSVSVEADLSWADATDSFAGITVKQGDKSVQLYAYSGNGNVILMKNEGWTDAADRGFEEMQGVSKRDASGVCKIKALVYQNKLYISYNGVQTVELDLATYIGGYVADEEVKIGLATWGANGGMPIFKNIELLADEDALPIYIAETSGSLEYDEREASITRTEANTATAYFTGSSQTWEVTGKMEQEDLSKLILQGFVVKARTNGNRNHWTEDEGGNWTATQWEELETRFYGQHDGFVTVGVRKDNTDYSSSDWNFAYNLSTHTTGTAGNASYYVLNENADSFFFAPAEGQARTNTTVDFRLVIAEDTMYLWLDDVLSWRIPLSAYTFGSYEAGSEYQLGVAFNSESGTVAFKNLTVKSGSEADISGIVRFAVVPNSDTNQNADICDSVSGMIERTDNSISKITYFAGTESNARATKWEVSGTMHRNSLSENVLMGFIVSDGTGSRRFYGNNQGFATDWWQYNYNEMTDTNGPAGEATKYIFNADIEQFFGGTKTKNEIDFRAVILDDILYVYFDEILSWKIPLTIENFGNFAAGSSYNLGVVFNGGDVGTASFRNLRVKSGNQVITADDTYIRDTYVLAENNTYYLYGSRFAGSVDVFTSKDLVTWEKHAPAYVPESTSWASGKELWAPEVHAYTYNGETNYYMFTSISGTYGDAEVQRGTVILKADSPYGPFKEWSEGPVTPLAWSCLDGTLYVEDGTPYMIFAREYTDETLENIVGIKTYNGEMYYVPLTQNLKAANGDVVKMFDAKSVAGLEGSYSGYVTDGPQIYMATDGNLFLLWSTFADGNGSTSNNRYIQMQLRSSNGKLVGAEWTYNNALPLLYGEAATEEDGGHGMVFTDFSNNLKLILHTPNFYNVKSQRTERMKILDIKYDTSNQCLTR